MSFTLNYIGDKINAILARANNGGEIDDELALKAPLASPALTGNPTAPTQPEEDNSTKLATTEYADRAADAAGAAAEAAAKAYTDEATSALYITDTASGSIASFSDGADGIPMRSVKASIEPIQDLHGYANPWPAGGGVNKYNISAANPTANSGITAVINSDKCSITLNGTATINGSVTVSIVNDSSLPYADYYYHCDYGANSRLLMIKRTGGQSRWINSGSVVTVGETDYPGYALVSFSAGDVFNNTVIKFQLNNPSSVTTWYPYSNICPIVSEAGKNKLDLSELASNASVTVIEVINPSYTFVGNGATNVFLRGASSLKLEPSTAYTLTGGLAQIAIRIREYDSSGTLLATHITSGSSALTFTTDANLSYCDVYVVFYTVPSTATTIEPVLRLAANPDPIFVPYRGVTRVDAAGKNLLNPSIWELGSISSAGNNSASNDAMRTRIDSLIPVKPNTTYTFSEKETSSEIWVTEYSGDTITVPRRKIVNNSRRGTFTTGENTTFIRLRVNCATSGVLNTETQLELGSADTAYEPYAARVYFSIGENIWDEQWELGSISSETGENVSATTSIRSKNYSPCIPGTYLYFSGNSGQAFAGVRWYGKDKDYLGYISSGNANNVPVAVPDNVYFFRLTFVAAYGATYKGDVAILNAPPEVWGGVIDVVSGKLTVTKNFLELDGDEGYANGTDLGSVIRFGKTWTGSGYSPSETKCNQLTWLNNFSSDTPHFYIYNSIAYFFLPKTCVPSSSSADIIAYLTAHPLQVVAPLVTPVTYQLKPQQITSLLGANNVWSNTGDVEVEYVADPKLYIDIAKMLGGSTLTLGSVSPLSVNRPVTISEEDLEQAGEVSKVVEAATETVLPAESGETEEGAQE